MACLELRAAAQRWVTGMSERVAKESWGSVASHGWSPVKATGFQTMSPDGKPTFGRLMFVPFSSCRCLRLDHRQEVAWRAARVA